MEKRIILSPIKEMEIRSAGTSGVVSLAQGVPSFDTPDCIKKKATEAILEGRAARYSLSPGILELRESIEHSLARENIFYDFEKEIIVTAGSIEAITATLLALIKKGEEVLIPDPTYTSYQAAIKTAGGIPAFFPLDEKKGWAFDLKELEKNINSRTRAVLFCNPNNPTGTVYSREQLSRLIELAEKHNLYILSDEVYRDFIYDDDLDFFSLAQFSGFRKRIIHIFSFSKAYAMTGWRVAYLAADRTLTEKILPVHDAMVTCAPVVSQWGALAALEMAKDDVAYFKQEFFHRREIICKEMEELKSWFSFVRPSSAYFVFPCFKENLIEGLKKIKLPERIQESLRDDQKRSLSWKLALDLLERAKVALVPGSAFGQVGENHLRLCFGRSEEDIQESLKRMKKYFNSYF